MGGSDLARSWHGKLCLRSRRQPTDRTKSAARSARPEPGSAWPSGGSSSLARAPMCGLALSWRCNSRCLVHDRRQRRLPRRRARGSRNRFLQRGLQGPAPSRPAARNRNRCWCCWGRGRDCRGRDGRTRPASAARWPEVRCAARRSPGITEGEDEPYHSTRQRPTAAPPRVRSKADGVPRPPADRPAAQSRSARLSPGAVLADRRAAIVRR